MLLRNVRLRSLLADKDIQELIDMVIDHDGEAISILDESGQYIMGAQDGGENEHPVFLNGEVLGIIVGNDARASHVSGLLSYLAAQENERNVMAMEALERIEEIKEFYDMAEQAKSSFDHTQLCRIVAEEAQRLFEAEEAAVLPDVTHEEEEEESSHQIVITSGPETEDLAEKARHVPPIASVGHHPVQLPVSTLLSPMRINGESVGFLRVASSGEGRYSSEDQKRLDILGTQVAASIESTRLYEKVNTILQTIEELNHLNDVDTILDTILKEARGLANADAGSIFLVEEDKLIFSYVHNDTLFAKDGANKAIYSSFSIPVSEKSIVGYAALTGRTIHIADAYNLPQNLPYTFNDSFDKQTGYRTTSILTIPLKSYQDRLVGVMQIINAKNDKGGYIPFPKESRTYIPLFANNAAVAIERGTMTRDMILRTMRLAELRNPKETAAHVQRVGAYSAEIYQRWARNRGLSSKEIKRFKDMIRIAAMLHDVGKVGIPDAILKKTGPLSKEEFKIMKLHTVYGARLFQGSSSELDKMCYDIAANHHEKWNGTGYPGHIEDASGDTIVFGAPKKGEEIPLAARIAALADVYDALSSKVDPEEGWSEDKVFKRIQKESGQYFDPDIVDAFFQILDVVKAIKERFRD